LARRAPHDYITIAFVYAVLSQKLIDVFTSADRTQISPNSCLTPSARREITVVTVNGLLVVIYRKETLISCIVETEGSAAAAGEQVDIRWSGATAWHLQDSVRVGFRVKNFL